MRPRICGVITGNDPLVIAAAEPLADLFEVRIDLIGQTWPEAARGLKKPWIATNRLAAEGGRWRGGEAERIAELMKALNMGASIVDLELSTPGLEKAIVAVKEKARCLVSHHDFMVTPSMEKLKSIIERQIAAGADICKLVTSPGGVGDNLTLLSLYVEFPGHSIVAFAMGETGTLSRVLAPLAGAEFTYAALGTGKESMPGQLNVEQLARIYRSLKAQD